MKIKKNVSLRQDVYAYVEKKYRSRPEYPWMKFPGYAVFRHKDNHKWYGLIMDIPKNKLGLPSDEIEDVLNVKCSDPYLADLLTREEGIFPGYHQNHNTWISILLDGTVPLDKIEQAIDESYGAAMSAKMKQKVRGPKEWLVPANPKYYDIEHAFDTKKELDWKQGRGILKGDIVYLYAGSPISAILYRCKVMKTDIPYEYSGEVEIHALMKLKLEKKYKPDLFSYRKLKDVYDVAAIRGPRGIPHALSEALK